MSDKFTITRSLHQASSGHVSATHTFITGYDRTGVIKGPPDNSDLCAVVNRMRNKHGGQMPHYVGIPTMARGGEAYLGPAFGPLRVDDDPSQPGFMVPNVRLNAAIDCVRFDSRLNMLGQLDLFRRELDASGQMEMLDQFRQRAVDVLTGPAAARAFDISREDPRLRARYGIHKAGQQALLARRLVEASVSVVAVRFHPAGPWHDS